MEVDNKPLTFQSEELKMLINRLANYSEENKLYIDKEFLDRHFKDIKTLRDKIKNLSFKGLNIDEETLDRLSQIDITKIVEFDSNLSKKDYEAIPFDRIIFEINRLLASKKSAKKIIDDIKEDIINFPNEIISASKEINDIIMKLRNESSKEKVKDKDILIIDESVCNKEVLEIISSFNESDYNKIPKEYIEFLIDNQSNHFDFKFDVNKSLDEQNVSIKARCILFALFKDYLINEKQRNIIESNINYSLELLENSTNDLINEIDINSNIEDIEQVEVRNALEEVLQDYVEDENCLSLMVCEEETILRRIFDKFKKFILKFKTEINEDLL